MNVLKVSQVNTYIKALFDESRPLKNIFVGGEISNFTHHYRSGHLYFTLKDETSQIKAVMFSSSASRIKFEPENGMKVICRGRISVYEKSGEYQLYVDDMQPDGIGALNLAFERLKEKLFKEGVCSDEIKKPLVQYPKKIGVVTSNIGAAVEDIKTITGRRYPLAEIVIAPTLVQGENAAPDIVKSIRLLDEMQDVDVIIVGRGGGSIEDLWAFNTEEVARAVIACKTPVVSAVGHETDFTICDFVADLRAPTPSAAAELVCPDVNVLISQISSLKYTMELHINSRLDNELQRLNDLTENGILADIDSFFNAYDDKISVLKERMLDAFAYSSDERLQRLSLLAGKLDALSPLAVLARGYCVAKREDFVINSAQRLQAGDNLVISFADGNAKCSVSEVTLNE